jgi:hypothetical protein
MTHDDGIDKVERALTQAYRDRSGPDTPSLVTQRVMTDIRQPAGRNGRREPVTGYERLVWRTAAVAAAVAVVVTIASVGVDRTTNGENGTLFGDDIELAYLLGEE